MKTATILLLTLMGAFGAMAEDSTLGTCRIEYADCYPSESYGGEPERC